MTKKKKIALICLSAALVVSMGVGVTLAYLGQIRQKSNKIEVGLGDVSIQEEFESIDIQKTENVNRKKIQVKNTGSTPCYVRVFAEFSDSRAAKLAKVTSSQTAPAKESSMWYSWDNFKLETQTENNTVAPGWVYVSDSTKLSGYFYYKTLLAPGEVTTEPLITWVLTDFDGAQTDSNPDLIRSFDITVYSETVQETEITPDGTKTVFTDWRSAWQSFLIR